jgi:hypothetical protein
MVDPFQILETCFLQSICYGGGSLVLKSFTSYSTVEDNESAAARIYRSEDLKEAFLNSLNVSLANANANANANGVLHVVLAA